MKIVLKRFVVYFKKSLYYGWSLLGRNFFLIFFINVMYNEYLNVNFLEL